MKYNKFVFLYTSNYCARVNDFFCIEEWIANGFDVEYWDLSAFTCHEHLADYSIKGLIIRTVESLRAFEDLVKEYQHDDTLYLTWVNYCWYSAGFYRILSKYNCKYAFFDNGLIPSFSSGKKTKRITAQKFYTSLRNRYYRHIAKALILKPADYYFQLSKYYTGLDKGNDQTIQGWCNSGDFERNHKLGTVRNDKYIVFLDQYIPYHNDNVLHGFKLVNAEDYFSSLNRCFGLIESKYGIPVVIAAHPAANKYKDVNPFNGRDIYFNKTAELVKGSEMVLAHFTTAISFVVLNKKRMLLLTSNAINEARPQINQYIVSLSELLGLSCINQDDAALEDIDPGYFCEDKYDDYKYRYLTNCHSECFSNYESIIKEIE